LKVHRPRRVHKREAPIKWHWVALVGLPGMAVQQWAGAATLLDNVSESNYTAYGAESQFASSGYVEVNGGSTSFGSATLIAPDWVLTAAHAVTQDTTGYPTYPAADITFGLGATASFPGPDKVAQVFVEPGWTYNTSAGDDLALLELSTPITNVAPAVLYNASLGSELGQTASMVGYGRSGTGLTGDTVGPGTRLGITNNIDAFGGSYALGWYTFDDSSNILFTDFDQPNNPLASILGGTTPTSLEGSSAPGDSGGGLFLTVNGQTYLAGVTSFLGALPSNPLSTNADGHYGDYNGYTRIAVSQSMSFIDSTLQTSSTWTTGGGSWASSSNWSGGNIPEFAGASAVFGSGITSPATITLDGSWTVGSVTFNNSNTYTLSPGTLGVLTLDNGAASAAIVDNSGTHCIYAPVVLNSNTQVTVANVGDTLQLWCPISGVGGLTIAGAGTVSMSGTNTYLGPTAVSSGTLKISGSAALPAGSAVANNGALVIAANTVAGNISGTGSLTIGSTSTPAVLQLVSGSGTSSESSLTVNPGSTLDITNNALVINYTGTSPVAAVLAELTSGYNQGTWTGTGITSSAAGLNPNHFAIGYADGNVDPATSALPNQVVVMYTINGDAKLAGTVNFMDLLIVAQHFGTTGNDWAEGNFNYNLTGSVGFSDLLTVAQNFNQSLPATQEASLSPTTSENPVLGQVFVADVSVPEPGAVALALAAGGGMLTRRRRSRP
jgi:autotransporter-associated beta strand protein